MQLAQHFPCLMLLHYAQGPLWIIVACRQIKNKRAPEQISTDAVTFSREGGGCEGGRYRVSKHVKVEGAKGGLGERWSRTEKMTMKREDKRMRK